MAEFTELVATAVANAESRAELAASRAHASSPRRTRRGAASSATSTTARSSGS